VRQPAGFEQVGRHLDERRDYFAVREAGGWIFELKCNTILANGIDSSGHSSHWFRLTPLN
jgi:hypothetical protein